MMTKDELTAAEHYHLILRVLILREIANDNVKAHVSEFLSKSGYSRAEEAAIGQFFAALDATYSEWN